MINLIKQQWTLFLILLLAIILRFWQLSSVPPSLTWDEAALGYNAYSIMLTGKDEYGTLFPLNLKSFGDYKPAVYAYLDIPFIAIFGLNEFAVRLPSAILGVLLVVVLYLLIKEIFSNKYFGNLVALSLAISPLAIYFSRAAFETNVAVFFNTLGAYLFIKGAKNNKWLILSAIIFGISMFTYQASRLFVPILVVLLFLIYKDQIKFNLKVKISAGIIVFFIALTAYLLFIAGQSNRLYAVSFFSYQRSNDELTQLSKEQGITPDSLQFQLLHGEWFYYIKGIFDRYLVYYSPKMLFFDGGDPNPRQDIPDFGLLYYSSIIFIPLGLFYLLTMKKTDQERKGVRLIIWWLILAPIPAILAKDLMNALRAFNIVIPWTILEGAGIYYILLISWHKNKYLFKLLALFICVVLIINMMIFFDRYFIHFPKEMSWGWVYGYREAFQKIGDKDELKKYSNVAVTDKYGQPYIYYLFYNKYPPKEYQKQAKLEQSTSDVGTIRKIDNIEFRFVDWRVDRLSHNALYVGTFQELPDNDVYPFPEFKVIDEVKFLDGEGAFRIVEVE